MHTNNALFAPCSSQQRTFSISFFTQWQTKCFHLKHYHDTLLLLLTHPICLESEVYLSRRNLRYSEQSCWEPTLNQGGRDASKKFLGAYAALCRENTFTTHTAMSSCYGKWYSNIPVYHPGKHKPECVQGRRRAAGASSSVCWSHLDLVIKRVAWNWGKIKLHPDYPHFCLLTKCTNALHECVCLHTQLTLWPWRGFGLYYSCSRCCPG